MTWVQPCPKSFWHGRNSQTWRWILPSYWFNLYRRLAHTIAHGLLRRPGRALSKINLLQPDKQQLDYDMTRIPCVKERGDSTRLRHSCGVAMEESIRSSQVHKQNPPRTKFQRTVLHLIPFTSNSWHPLPESGGTQLPKPSSTHHSLPRTAHNLSLNPASAKASPNARRLGYMHTVRVSSSWASAVPRWLSKLVQHPMPATQSRRSHLCYNTW